MESCRARRDTAEAIKADTETAVNMLHSLFSKIWEKEEVPAQWKEGIVIKLPKKGDLRDCSNYRGIMAPVSARQDYEKAFDSVDREALWKLLRHYGVPGKIISLIQCTYKDMSCRIAHAGQLSESFELDDLDFADDLALLSHSHSQMQDKTTCLEATSAGTGLKINRRKTELMKINTTASTPVTVGGEPIREVESFVYLGSVVDGQGGTDRDVTARIGKARAAMVMLKNIWASKVVSIRTKLRIYNSNVKSVLLYGCETWKTTKTMQQKIQTFLNTCLRRIFNIRWPEKIRNEELWERAGQEPAAKQILRRNDPNTAVVEQLVTRVDSLQAKLDAEKQARVASETSARHDVQTLQSQVHSLQSQAQNLQSQLDSEKQKTQQLQAENNHNVAFSAYMSHQPNVPASDGSIVPFGGVITNVGNAYNPSSGVFTAPYSGPYMFFVHADITHDYRAFNLCRNGHVVIACHNDQDASRLACGGVMALSPGDTVTVVHVQSTGHVDAGRETVFSGFRIH
nr:hypothetical protein BaRGS_002416 [Batillaria attramentaria]